ncbi:MAG: UvrD-helicase domain-containing protein [Candidatus Omnitrophica bacterium]|nr:UvrD-helicase domain-containing protein [Candidatus Omnitrophota bacterium]
MNNHDPRVFQFPHVYIVEASAGSGKTYCLARRYVQLLINPRLAPKEIPLESILAITFTNKSTIEMKERILEFLKKIALDAFSNVQEKEAFIALLGVTEEAARQKAGLIMEHIIRNYNFFQVQTIDSFINAILSGCAFKLDLSATFKTRQNHAEYLAYSLDALIDKALIDSDVLKLFKGFIRQYLFIDNKAGWFPKQDMFKNALALFSQHNRMGGEFQVSAIEVSELITLKRDVLKLMQQLRVNLPDGTNGSFAKALVNFLSKERDSFSLDELSDYFNHADFPLNKGYPLPAETKKTWARIRKELKALCEVESFSIFNYDIALFYQMLKELQLLSQRENVLFLEALNKEARVLFDEKSLSLPELYYRLACRFRHFLIDEFQDTSVLQWENLHLMVEEALSTGGSLFYVGDPKQAIYRFRGGEVALISEVKQALKGGLVIEEALQTNFRSLKEIVDFNNAIFSPESIRIFLEKIQARKKDAVELSADDTARIVEVFCGSTQQSLEAKVGGLVRVTMLDIKGKDELDEALRDEVLAIIQDARKRVALGEIALLARTNDEVERFTSWLLSAGIPAESEKTLDIRQNAYIKELVSLLQFLNSPIDNLAFASFIIGDIFTRSSGIARETIQEFMFALNRKERKERMYLYREFRQQFPDAWDTFFEDFFKSVGYIPLYELTVSIMGKFMIPTRASEFQGFFMRFLELIKEEEQDEIASIASFLEFFEQAPQEKLYVHVGQSESVKILTIHKAKGLEFEVVVIPSLEMNIKIGSAVVIETPQGAKLVHLKKRYQEFSDLLARHYREEYCKVLLDELNSIYVALTRAKAELYVLMSPKLNRGALNLASLLFPPEALERGSAVALNARLPEQAVALEIPPSEYKDWVHALKDEFEDESLLGNRQKIVRGQLLHFILAGIGNLAHEDLATTLAQTMRKAKAQFPFAHDIDSLEATVKKLLEHRDLASYFNVADGMVHQEKEVVNAFGDSKRIDRLIVKPKEVVIIDYKSTKEGSQDYRAQVQEYMQIMKSLFPKRAVKGAVVFLDDLSVEEIHGTR